MLGLLVAALPLVAPCGSEHPAVEFGAVLQIVLQVYFRRGIVSHAPVARDVGEKEFGEGDGRLSSELRVVVALIAF